MNISDIFTRMKFPQNDIIILATGMTVVGIAVYLYRLYKNKTVTANLSIAMGTLEEQLLSLTKDFYEIGREEKTDMIQINSPKVSRQHAFINKKTGKFYLTDNNSTNGTYVNEKRIQPNSPHLLTHQDEVKIGGIALRFYDLKSIRK